MGMWFRISSCRLDVDGRPLGRRVLTAWPHSGPCRLVCILFAVVALVPFLAPGATCSEMRPAGLSGYLRKPFRTEELAQAVRQSLDDRPGGDNCRPTAS